MRFDFRKAPLAGLFALTLAVPALAAPANPDRVVGPQADGSVVASDNQTLTPAGTRVLLGSPVVSKALAINPKRSTHTAAVLTMTGGAPIEIINLKTGLVVQRFSPFTYSATAGYTANTEGSDIGVTYSPDGTKLLFSQDNNYLSVADVDPATGLVTPNYSVFLPALPGSPFTTLPQCGIFYSSTCAANLTASGYLGTQNPGAIAVTADNTTALVSSNVTNAVGVYDLTQSPAVLKTTIAVGNVPNSIVIRGTTAFVSNEGGRPATSSDFTNVSDGDNIVVDKKDAFATTGTVSVIDLATSKVTKTINVGLHPAGMFLSGALLYVANSFSDSVSVIDTASKLVVRTIDISVPTKTKTFGAGPNSLVVVGTTLYVALGQSSSSKRPPPMRTATTKLARDDEKGPGRELRSFFMIKEGRGSFLKKRTKKLLLV
jgi:YVTN family beta-propeller protein